MATIEKGNVYILTLSEVETEALWFHLKYAYTDEEEENTAPTNYIKLQEIIYQAVRKILNKD
jgi:hypothetical protein